MPGDAEEVWRGVFGEECLTIIMGKVMVQDGAGGAAQGWVDGPDVLAAVPKHFVGNAGACDDRAVGTTEAGRR